MARADGQHWTTVGLLIVGLLMLTVEAGDTADRSDYGVAYADTAPHPAGQFYRYHTYWYRGGHGGHFHPKFWWHHPKKHHVYHHYVPQHVPPHAVVQVKDPLSTGQFPACLSLEAHQHAGTVRPWNVFDNRTHFLLCSLPVSTTSPITSSISHSTASSTETPIPSPGTCPRRWLCYDKEASHFLVKFDFLFTIRGLRAFVTFRKRSLPGSKNLITAKYGSRISSLYNGNLKKMKKCGFN